MIRTPRLFIYPLSRGGMERFLASQPEGPFREAVSEMLEGCLSHPGQWEWYSLHFIERADGTHVGELCFKGLGADGSVEIGYGVSPAEQGKGYASEAVRAMCGWAFQHPQVTAVTAKTDPENAASRRVLEKCGFLPDGSASRDEAGYILVREKADAREADFYEAGFPPEAVHPLLYWYAREARILPWRTDPTPYRVWISEIMLQQTRVSAVVPYYLRFLERFPDPAALAAADEEALRKAWEGLGYYSRVRNLQRAARVLTESFGGELPADRDALGRLPGIGPYTAGAIASIAFGLPEPAVDGNVLRVFSRIAADSSDLSLPKVRSRITEDLRTLYRLFPGDASRLTQSLMELGAVVCLPNGAPLCNSCPLRDFCRAREAGNQTDYPVRKEKKARRREEKTVFLLTCRGRIGIRKRPDSGLLAGLWEIPCEDGVLPPERVAEAVRAMGGTLKGDPVSAGETTHVFTHVEWHMTGWEAELDAPCRELVFADLAEIRERYCVPSAFRPFLDGIARKERIQGGRL